MGKNKSFGYYILVIKKRNGRISISNKYMEVPETPKLTSQAPKRKHKKQMVIRK